MPSEPASGDGFSDLSDIMGIEDLDSQPLVPAEPTPAAPATETPPPPEAQMQPAPAGQTPQTPTAQATPPQGQQAPSPPPSPAEPGKLAEMMQQNYTALAEQVSGEFVLSKEEAEALETDVVGTLPKL